MGSDADAEAVTVRSLEEEDELSVGRDIVVAVEVWLPLLALQ